MRRREFIAGSAGAGFICHSDEAHVDGRRVMRIDGKEPTCLVVNASPVDGLIQKVS